MNARSASEGLSALPSALPSAEPQTPAKPPARLSAVLPSPLFTYGRAFVLSVLVHGLVLSAMSSLGVGPRVALGNPWGSSGVDPTAFTLVMAPASSGGSSGELDQALEAEALEHMLESVELEAPPLLPDTADAEQVELDLAALTASLGGLPLEPEAASSQTANPFAAEPRTYRFSRAQETSDAGGAQSLAQLDAPGAPVGSSGGAGSNGTGSNGTADQGDGQASPLGLPNGAIGGYLPPTFAGLTPPDYPHSARRLGHEGSALIRIQVSASGRVLDVELVESSGYELLDQTALGAARTWRFHPATQDGLPIAASLLHRVTFRLEER